MKKIISLMLIFIPVLFISCGEEKKEPPKNDNVVVEPKEIDACSYIDKSVVEKIFNAEMNEPKKGRSQKGDAKKASFSECSFTSAEEGSRFYMSVYIRFTPFKDEYHTTIQSVRSSFKQSGIEIEDISGLGQVAFWGGNQLHVFKDDNYYIIITLLGADSNDDTKEKARTVARHVLGNLDSV